jgi:hypothetical protein
MAFDGYGDPVTVSRVLSVIDDYDILYVTRVFCFLLIVIHNCRQQETEFIL